MKRASIALWVALCGYVGYLIYDWVTAPPKPKELTTQELAEQDMTWVMFLSGGHNALNKRVRDLETKLDRLERQMAGELPQIDGGIEYGRD